MSFPSKRITAPAGVLATERLAPSEVNSIETEEFAPDNIARLRLAEAYPALVAVIVCCPGAMPVKVHGVSHNALPSNEIFAPAGVEDTESCAGTIAGTARAVALLPLACLAGAALAGSSVSA